MNFKLHISAFKPLTEFVLIYLFIFACMNEFMHLSVFSAFNFAFTYPAIYVFMHVSMHLVHLLLHLV